MLIYWKDGRNKQAPHHKALKGRVEARPSPSAVIPSCIPLSSCRRFVWNFFRLENEHLNNCGEFRAVRDISVAPLNADDQTLLEQMMDQEDGVRNRSGKKTWKRSYSLSLRRPLLSSSQ